MAIKRLEVRKGEDYFTRSGLPCVVREMHAAPSNEIIPIHDHEFSELVVVASGSLSHFHSAGTSRLRTGDFFAVHPGERHGYANLTRQTVVFNILYHCSRPPAVLALADISLMPQLFPKEPSECKAHTIGHISKRELPHVVNIIREIRREEDARRPMGAAICSALFAAQLLRPPCAAEDATPASESPIQAELDYITQNISGKITFRELCAVSGKSVSTLSREFKKSTGRSPGDYIIALRVEKARSLLSQSKKRPLAKIAAMTGFCSAGHLSRTLHRTKAPGGQ